MFCAQLANRKKRKDDVKYDQLVDIWSLAVLLVMLECGELPKYLDHYTYSGSAWGGVMVEFVRRYQIRHGTNDLRSFLLEDMLVVDPEKRQPAKKCHEKALQLFGGGTGDNGEDSGEESNPATPRALLPEDVTSFPNNSGASEASTIRLCPRDGEDNGQSSELSGSRVLALGSESLIVDLGENGSDFIDSLLGMKPSESTEFELSNAPTADTIQRASVVDNELWEAEATSGARGSVAGLEEREKESAQRGTDSDSVGSGLRATIILSLATAA